MSLTPKQKQTLDFVVDFTKDNGYSPSFIEIAKGIEVASISRVHTLITALKDRGYVATRAGGRRTIEILRSKPSLGGEQ